MLNRKLGWALGGTLVLTAVALLVPEDAELPRVDVERSSDGSAPLPGMATDARGGTFPSEIERQAFSVPERDPFAAPVPLPPVAAPAPPAPVGPPPPPPPSPPPPLTAGYMAQLLPPSGERVIYLRDGEQMVAAQVGAVLSGGYVIEALVRADGTKAGAASAPQGVASGAGGTDVIAVELVHPPSNHRQVIPIPQLHRPPQ